MHPEGAEVLATYESDFYAGKVDLITGEAAKEGDVMNKWDVKILQEAL